MEKKLTISGSDKKKEGVVLKRNVILNFTGTGHKINSILSSQ